MPHVRQCSECRCRCRTQVKFIYDHVFEGHTDNRTVHRTVASPIVQSALDGINGTIFACAVPLPRAGLLAAAPCR